MSRIIILLALPNNLPSLAGVRPRSPEAAPCSAGLSDKRCVESGRFSLLSGSFEPTGEGNRERIQRRFHLVTQRARPPPVGLRDLVTRYRHFRASAGGDRTRHGRRHSRPDEVLPHHGCPRNLAQHERSIQEPEPWRSDGAAVVHIPDRPRADESADKDKLADHTFSALARLGAVGEYAPGMVKDLSSSVFKSVEAPQASFIKRLMPNVGERINLRASTAGFPILINAKEFSALMGWPLNGSGAKRAKRIAPTVVHDSEGIVIGTRTRQRCRTGAWRFRRKPSLSRHEGFLHQRYCQGWKGLKIRPARTNFSGAYSYGP